MRGGVVLLTGVETLTVTIELSVSELDAWRRKLVGTPSIADARMVCVGTLTMKRDKQGRRLVRMLYLGVGEG